MKPNENEPICLLSFEVTKIRLGGGPDTRTSFWKVYRQELALNQRTHYQNEHLRICRPMLMHLKNEMGKKVYYRHERLVTERQLSEDSK